MNVMKPELMNEAFARAFNDRNIDALLRLYEPAAVLRPDATDTTIVGTAALADALRTLLQLPGRMVSINNFCIERDGLALLRADWTVSGHDGVMIAAGSSAEIVRRQADGRWLYMIDHAVGASLPIRS